MISDLQYTLSSCEPKDYGNVQTTGGRSQPEAITFWLTVHLAGKSRWQDTSRSKAFREFAKLVKRCGWVRVIPEKTRIAFQVRMSFTAVSLRRDRIVGHFALARPLENPRFTKVETISPRNHVHSFCFTSCAQMNKEALSWLREAYRVGQ